MKEKIDVVYKVHEMTVIKKEGGWRGNNIPETFQ